ncbi:peptidoglycan DD-metalloendopeptidase family protein [Corynebacterium macclintockiae]|uniref:peptidoglycan DD-metalloendopeptidase family protein n=1 Tax=Corynebacterium macclintockiae TaxID=2913501 RepID=UPI003EBF0C54
MKKVLAILLTVVLLIVLLIVTVFDNEDEEKVCVDEPGSSSGSGGGDAVVDGDFAYPTDKDAVHESSPFGPRGGEMHYGFDLAGPRGTPIYAFADGEVVYAADSGVSGFGGWVVLDHTIDGEQIQTVYGHEEPGQVHVKVGDKVKKGQHIADIGSAGYSSGPHLHFEVVKGDRAAGGEKVDPKPWLDKASASKPKESDAAQTGRSSAEKGEAKPENQGKNPNSGKDVPIGVSNNPDDLDKYQINHIRRIISIGKGRGENEQTIRAAIMAAGQEGGYRMLASKAVPESLKYPNDGVTPGDYDSVGLFAIRTPMNGPVDKAMNAEWQINWFYDTAHKQADVNAADWEIAANVERPREDLRWKYKNWKAITDKVMETEGDIAPSEDSCMPGGGGDSGKTPANASEFAKKAIEAARKQMGLPYRWGGGDYNGPTPGQDGGSPGFDCSGLTLYAYAQASGGKIKLPHYTGDSSNPGQLGAPELTDVPMDDVKPGDLVFFGSKSNPHHVGLAIDKDTMIHAPDRGQNVTEAKISSMGDFSGVRRLTEDALREGK